MARAASNAESIVNFKGLINLSNVNILWAFIAGHRFQHDDIKLKKLIDAVNLMFQNSNIYQRSLPVPDLVMKLFPFLRRHLGSDPEVFRPIVTFISVRFERLRLRSKQMIFHFAYRNP